MVATSLSPFQESIQSGSDHFRYTNNTHESIAQPPARKAPRKPAPPVPPLTNPNTIVAGHELLKTNNNDYYEDGKKISPVPLARSSSQKPSFRNSAFVIGSSSETIDSCGSRSPIQNGEIGSLDRRIRRNSSERRPVTDRHSVSNYRASKLIGKPNVAPPSIPRRPNIPPPERPGRTVNELTRQRSVDNIFDDHHSSQRHSCNTMSKSFCVRSSSQEDETKDDEVNEEEGGVDEISQVKNDVIRLKLKTGIERPECEKNGEETLVTSRKNSSENHEIPVCKEMSYEIAALPPANAVTCDSRDVNSNTTSRNFSPTDENSATSVGTSNGSMLHKSSSQELSSDQFKVKPPKPLPPPIKPRITSLNEASRL